MLQAADLAFYGVCIDRQKFSARRIMRSPGWVLLTALVILVCLGATASPQAPSADTPKPAANAWMLTPTPYLEWNKGISPEIRAARDRYADVLQGASARKYPLT